MEQFVVSARKYRPQTFKDVVGQQAITNTLVNAIETNHLAQALLFTGPRGVGKTTCARILARKINQPGYDDPNEDFTFNVFELDAASNNSVDDIRSLIDQVRIPPQTGKYKVYIIDEVHMLSTSAFNAFLKTLEEPPAHAIFILATTEKHKILPTILSRCQIFDFKRITIQDAKEHLAEVARSQNITFEDDALQIIAQKADGAMRDALSIFDRVVSFCGNNLTRKAVAENLNVLDFEIYIELTHLIIENKIPEILLQFNDILAKGFDAHQFIIGLASHFRDLIVCKNPNTLILLEAGEVAQKLYKEQAEKANIDFLLQAIDLANTCDLKYKTSQNQRLLVELCLMQLASITFEQKKKFSNEFIIPSQLYKDSQIVCNQSIPATKELAKDIVETNTTVTIEDNIADKNEIQKDNILESKQVVSKFSLLGLQKKKEAEQIQKERLNQISKGPVKPIVYDNLITHWNNFAKTLNQNGEKIMYTYMVLDTPKLEGNTIKLDFPNNSSKEDFTKRQGNLVAYLRENLENFELTIDITINEEVKQKFAFTPEEKFEKLKEINPTIDLMRKLFELELN